MRTLEVGKWIYLRDLRHHTILLHPDGVIAFGVVGLTQPIRALTGGPGFLFEAGIMAIEGHFVCDGLLGETVALGWTNSHLHRFRIHGEDYMPVDQENEPGTRDEKVPLKRVDLRLKTKIRYDYDFGDSWEHQILVEGLLLLEEPAEVPACIGGQRKCPPEDCGGAGGYQEMLDALRNPRDPRGEELRIWLGTRTWDAESFDLGQVNEAIAKAIAPRGGRRGAASRS
jgi:hypothetical protein